MMDRLKQLIRDNVGLVIRVTIVLIGAVWLVCKFVPASAHSEGNSGIVRTLMLVFGYSMMAIIFLGFIALIGWGVRRYRKSRTKNATSPMATTTSTIKSPSKKWSGWTWFWIIMILCFVVWPMVRASILATPYFRRQLHEAGVCAPFLCDAEHIRTHDYSDNEPPAPTSIRFAVRPDGHYDQFIFPESWSAVYVAKEGVGTLQFWCAGETKKRIERPPGYTYMNELNMRTGGNDIAGCNVRDKDGRRISNVYVRLKEPGKIVTVTFTPTP